jgi:hypothetical protein
MTLSSLRFGKCTLVSGFSTPFSKIAENDCPLSGPLVVPRFFVAGVVGIMQPPFCFWMLRKNNEEYHDKQAF